MKKVRKICCRITPRRVWGAIVVAACVVNLVIVGTVLDASASSIAETATLTRSINFVATTFFAPTATGSILPSITLSPTDEPTQTPTASATFTPTFTPTETSTPTFTATASPTATTCSPWYWWFVYIVPAGDTLSHISSLTGASVYELMVANCLPDTRIYAGQMLYVPRLPIVSTDTFTPPQNTPTDFERAAVCLGEGRIVLSVIATDAEGIRYMAAFYRMDTGEGVSNIPMRSEGDLYFGSQPRTAPTMAANTIHYWFVSTDTTGSTAQSGEYTETISFCGR